MIPACVKASLHKFRFTTRVYDFVKGRYSHCLNRRHRSQLREFGAEAFNRIYEIMSRHGYAYFANYGTLLGVVREHGFVKNDDDIDLSIPANTITAADLVRAFEHEDGFSFACAYEWRGRITNITFAYKGLPIDFFFQYIENGVNYSHWYDPVDGKWCNEEGGRFAFRRPIPIAEEIELINLFGGVVPVPGNADEILASCYGDWRTPVDKNLRVDYEDVRPPKTLLPDFGRMLSSVNDVCLSSRIEK